MATHIFLFGFQYKICFFPHSHNLCKNTSVLEGTVLDFLFFLILLVFLCVGTLLGSQYYYAVFGSVLQCLLGVLEYHKA